MCGNCEMTENLSWGDITERFSFEMDTVSYYDGPLDGYMRCKSCETRFAFKTTAIITDRLWHWILIATDSSSNSPFTEVLDRAKETDGDWLSIVEDGRPGDSSRCSGARFSIRDVRPPHD